MNAIRNILFLFLLTACSSRTPDTARAFHVYEEDGITVAETTGGPKYEGELFAYEKVVELQFDPEVEESLLIRPWCYTIDSNGHIYVADAGNHRIAVFGLDGKYIRSIGRHGVGPGDLFDPTRVFLWNDTLIIPDSPRGRTTYYRTDGTFLYVLSYPLGGPSMHRLDKASDGTRIVQSYVQVRNPDFEGQGDRATMVNSKGDTIAEIEAPIVVMAKMVNAEQRVYISSTGTFTRRTISTRSYLHFIGGSQVTYHPDREEILVSTGEEPVLKWYGLDGNLRREIRVNLPEQNVSEDEKRDLIAAYDQAIREAMEIDDENRRQIAVERAKMWRDILIVPDRKAYWNWALVDDKGFIWLRKPFSHLRDISNRSYSWYVLSPEGEYLGDTHQPPTLLGGAVINGFMCNVLLDTDTDEWIPTVFRVTSVIEGLEY